MRGKRAALAVALAVQVPTGVHATTPNCEAEQLQERLDEARSQRERGEYGQSAHALRGVLATCPDSDEARLDYALALAFGGEHDDAVHELDRLVDSSRVEKKDNLRLLRARVRAWSGDLDRALVEAEDVQRKDPKNLESYRVAGFIHRASWRMDEARQAYGRVLDEAPDDVESTEALEKMDELARFKARVAGGAAHFEGATTQATGTAELTYLARPDLDLMVGYDMNSPLTVLDTQESTVHQPRGAATYRPLGWLTLGLGYAAQIGEGRATNHLPSARVAAQLGEGSDWSVLGGGRVGLSGEAGVSSALVDVGLQWSYGAEGWALIQAFGSQDDQGQRDAMGVLTVEAPALGVLRLRGGGGGGTVSGANAGTIIAAPRLQWSDAWATGIQYTGLFTELLTRHEAQATAEVAW